MSTEAWLEKPIWSVCKLGSRGYYWATWPSYDAYVDRERPTADGIVPNLLAAQSAAYAAGAGPQTGANFARAYRRRLAAEKRSGCRSAVTSSAPIEFVYVYWTGYYFEGEYTNESWTPHRVVKKTARRVYVEKERYRPDRTQAGDWTDFDVRTIVVDRLALERDGWAGHFYLKSERPASAPRIMVLPDQLLVTLGLGPDAGEREIRQAYRRKAHATHPDHGGDPAEFKRVQAAYEAALHYVGAA